MAHTPYLYVCKAAPTKKGPSMTTVRKRKDDLTHAIRSGLPSQPQAHALTHSCRNVANKGKKGSHKRNAVQQSGYPGSIWRRHPAQQCGTVNKFAPEPRDAVYLC